VVDFQKLTLKARLEKARKTGSPMPASSKDRQAALTIMEWAYEEGAAVGSTLVNAYRKFFERPFVDEAHWRCAFDMALDIWKTGDDQRRQAAF
jgi:hypothetical protein